MTLTIDSYAWVEIIRDSPQGQRAQELMEGDDQCLTPSIVLAEVASAGVRDGIRHSIIREQLESIRESSRIVAIDYALAVEGAQLTIELRRSARTLKLPLPGLADGLVLATARLSGSRLLTGDPHFRTCPETTWLA